MRDFRAQVAPQHFLNGSQLRLPLIAVFISTIFLATVGGPSAAFSETQKSAIQLTIDDGLSQSTVSDILQADDGRMWSATGDGLSIFDGVNFEYVYRTSDQVMGLANNYTSALARDAAGHIWVATLGGGVAVFRQDATALARTRASDGLIASDEIFDLAADATGSVWAASGGGLSRLRIADGNVVGDGDIVMMDTSFRSVIVTRGGAVYVGADGAGLFRFEPMSGEVEHWDAARGLTGTVVLDLLEDDAGAIWIATEDDGAFRLDPDTGVIDRPVDLPDSDIEAVAQDLQGRIWFGSWSEGIFVYDPVRDTISNYRSQPGVRQRLSSDTIVALTPGDLGRMWIGTYDNGVSSVSQADDLFETYFPLGTGIATPGASVIWALAADGDDTLWVGSMGGLLRLDRGEHSLTPVDLGVPGVADVRAILTDPEGLIVAVRGEGLLQRQADGTFLTVTDPAGTPVVAEAFIRLLLRATDGTLWVGTHDGVYHLGADFTTLAHYTAGNGLPHNRTRSLTEGPDGAIWIGTSGGLSRWTAATNDVSLYAGADLLPDLDVRAVWQASPGAPIYVGTQAGLAIIDPATRTTRTIGRSEGLPNETIYKMIPDLQGVLWITTNNGLVRLDPAGGPVQVFRASDGLQGAEFNFNAGTRLPDGRIAVGGINGLSLFDPAAILTHRVPPRVTARWSPPVEARLVAPLGLNVDVRVIQYDKPADNLLRWRLLPHETDWRQSAGVMHNLRYETLSSGRYTLEYQGLSAAQLASPIMAVPFAVVPPPSQSWWAYLAYLMMTGVLFLVLSRLRTRRIVARNRELEEAVAVKTVALEAQNTILADAARARAAFYARTAHEIRTPLSMIRAPLANALKVPGLPPEAARLIALVGRAAARMTELTRSMDRAATAPDGVPVGQTALDLTAFIQPIVAYYRDMAAERGLVWRSDTTVFGAVTLDGAALDALLHNLLSNAVRHTSDGGAIDVRITTTDSELSVTVQNDGPIGDQAATEMRDPGSAASTVVAAHGTGIIAQSIRRLNGRIDVAAEPVTVISVVVPLTRAPSDHDDQSTTASQDNIKVSDDAGAILVVEDDSDLRRFLHDMLIPLGPVRAVGSLAAARRAIDRHAIRLVLCDAMLPDGAAFDFAAALKAHPATGHIPLIFLTAMQSETAMRAGEAAWADDYITKPFDPDHVLQRIRLRLRAAERAQERAESALPSQNASAVQSTAAPFDQRLADRFRTYLDDNIADPDASVRTAATACGVSERMLQRKLDSLFGQSFTDLLAARRMDHAAVLLRQHELSVAEVAVACGYRNMSSFSRKFRSHHGQPPRSFAKGD